MCPRLPALLIDDRPASPRPRNSDHGQSTKTVPVSNESPERLKTCAAFEPPPPPFAAVGQRVRRRRWFAACGQSADPRTLERALMLLRPQRCLRAVGHAECPEDARQVSFDRLLADSQPHRNVL